MNWNGFIVMTGISLMAASAAFGQANLLNATTPEDIGKKTEAQIKADNEGNPLKYAYVDDRDILWSKILWEVIDLDERINLPLYYPVNENVGKNRKSLFQILVEGIRNKEITEVYSDSYFTEKLTVNDVNDFLTRIDTTDYGMEQLNAGEAVSEEYIDKKNITASEIEAYKIRSFWYFDKRDGELKSRIMGICPVAPDINSLGSENPELVDLFWVWYPGIRSILHKHKVFNPQNSAYPFSFDHLLNARRFNAMVYKEENIYGDRGVSEYVKGNAMMQLLESERIKEGIRDFEQDMWSY